MGRKRKMKDLASCYHLLPPHPAEVQKKRIELKQPLIKSQFAEVQKMIIELKQPLIKSQFDIYSEQVSDMSPSCSQHVEASGQTFPKRIIRKRVKKSNSKLPEQCYSRVFLPRERTKRSDNTVNLLSNQIQKLDSNVFECYLEHLWRNLSEEKGGSFVYLDCLWFNLYREKKSKPKVLTWIKSKHIFNRTYVFVPIVCWNHWSLLILCHFGQDFDSKTRRPCMLLLDSLKKSDPKRLEPDIRKFVSDIYKEEGRLEKKSIAKIPLMVPKVPQQKNGEDCGIFVLYFIKMFLERAPDHFDSLEAVPYFMNTNWISGEGVDSFCKEVRSFCRKMREPTGQCGKMCLEDSTSPTTPVFMIE